jgi:DNA polymerase III epsilon subunit-like protein
MIIVGLDVETTGTVAGSEVVEIGWCVYATEEDAPLAGGHEILLPERWSKEAEAIHQISPKMVRVAGLKANDLDLWSRVAPYNPDAVVAHNAEFDHKFIRKHWKEFCNRPWICTMDDLHHELIIRHFRPWAYSKKIHLIAADYGIRYEPDDLHRAYIDAVLCCKIAAKHIHQPSPYGLRDLVVDRINAKMSGKLYKDVVIKGQFQEDMDREAFRQYGFKYEKTEDKKWHKKIHDPWNNEEFQQWARDHMPEAWLETPGSIRTEDLCSVGSLCTMRNIEV